MSSLRDIVFNRTGSQGATEMKRRILAVIAVLGLLAGAAVAVYAETGTVTVAGGALSVTTANVTLSGVTLTGADLTSTSASASNNWTGTDARGTGAGWNMTIDSTDFTDGGTPLRTIDISAVVSKFRMQLTAGNIGVTAGNAAPTTQVAALTDIPEAPAAALKFVSAAVDAGMGSYTMNPNFDLGVPAETFVGTGTYTATITLTTVSAP